jgi:pimeloyl-ACP methyl ester carboxylesterase
VIVPSLPGYGFSEAPKTDGSGSVYNMAKIMHQLMVEELGYQKYSKFA